MIWTGELQVMSDPNHEVLYNFSRRSPFCRLARAMPKTYRNKRADSRSARRYLRAALILGGAALMLLFTTSPVGVPTQAVLLPARVIVSAPALPAARAVAAPAPTLGLPVKLPGASEETPRFPVT